VRKAPGELSARLSRKSSVAELRHVRTHEVVSSFLCPSRTWMRRIDLLLEQVRGEQWRNVCIDTRLSSRQPSRRHAPRD
jgi:hypothetical protein